MLPFEFKTQMQRLDETFGGRAFPKERVELIWKQVSDMDTLWFSKLCDRIIGDMRNPPLASDFREAAYKERQSKFTRETEDASRRWDTGEFEGLPKQLESIGATSLVTAMDQERWKIRKGQDDFPEETK